MPLPTKIRRDAKTLFFKRVKMRHSNQPGHFGSDLSVNLTLHFSWAKTLLLVPTNETWFYGADEPAG
jgi:transketolase N-terminal domain/subunit